MRNAIVVGEDGGRGRALRECEERERGRDWRKRMKPFFFGTVGERESDTTCVEVLCRRIAERGGSFISSGPLSFSLLAWNAD